MNQEAQEYYNIASWTKDKPKLFTEQYLKR